MVTAPAYQVGGRVTKGLVTARADRAAAASPRMHAAGCGPIFAEAKICRPANTLRLSLSFYEAGGLRPQRFRVVDPRQHVLGPAAGTVGHLPGARLWRGTEHGASVDGNA